MVGAILKLAKSDDRFIQKYPAIRWRLSTQPILLQRKVAIEVS